jgi:hypothetical protein
MENEGSQAKSEGKAEEMAGKFNVHIAGGSGHIFMGDHTRVDIKDGRGRGGM